jgi:hypothetical protein
MWQLAAYDGLSGISLSMNLLYLRSLYAIEVASAMVKSINVGLFPLFPRTAG